MRDAYVVGIGAVPVGKYPDVLEHELLSKAFLAAVRDAGVTKQEIDALVFASPRQYSRQRYFGTFFAAYLGLPVDGLLAEVVGNGMTGGLAFDSAVQQIQLGHAEISIALGVSIETTVTAAEHMEWDMRAVGDVDFHAPLGVTPISWYALDATRYMYDYDVSHRELAAVAVKNRGHASLNPLAQFREPITVEDVLASRPIVKPLHLLDVPPRSDGAVAIVLASEDACKRLAGRPVKVLGRGFHHEGVHQVSSEPRSNTIYRAAQRAAATAFETAELGPDDMDLAEIYAPCSIVELILAESVGFVQRGEGARATARGETTLGGRIPISTGGGLPSRGHPPLVTPLYNVVEVIQQLRGDCGARQVAQARIGMSTAELGDYNSALIHIFGGVHG